MLHPWQAWNCPRAVHRWCCIPASDILPGDMGLGDHWIKSRHPRESAVGNVISSLFLTALPVCTLPLWRSVGAACVVIVSNPSIVGVSDLWKADGGQTCCLCDSSCWDARLSLFLTRLYDGVALHTLLHCSTVLCLSWPENHVPLWFPSSTNFFAAGLYHV